MVAPYSGRIGDFLGVGPLADRPAALNIKPGSLGIWQDPADLTTLSLWDSNALAWNDFSGGGGGGGGGFPMFYDLSKGVPHLSAVTQIGDNTKFAYTENPGIALNVRHNAGSPAAELAGFAAPLMGETVSFAVMVLPTMTDEHYYGPGIGVYDSTTGKFVAMAALPGVGFSFAHWNDYHTRAAFSEPGYAWGIQGPIWLHVDCDGTTMRFGFSGDGVHPEWRFSEAIATFIGSFDHAFFGMFAQASPDQPNINMTFLCFDDLAASRTMGTSGSGGGGGGGGSRGPVQLGTLRPLSDFAQVNVSGTKSVIENPGKAITLLDTSPPASTTTTFGLTIAAPAAPYRVAAFIQYNTLGSHYHGPMFGHQDAAGKLQTAGWHYGDNNTGFQQYSDPNSRSSYSNTGRIAAFQSVGIWVAVHDDGTTIWYEVSSDGAYFSPFSKVLKSSGSLADYNKIYIGIEELCYDYAGGDNPLSMSILDYIEDGLTRQAGGG